MRCVAIQSDHLLYGVLISVCCNHAIKNTFTENSKRLQIEVPIYIEITLHWTTEKVTELIDQVWFSF